MNIESHLIDRQAEPSTGQSTDRRAVLKGVLSVAALTLTSCGRVLPSAEEYPSPDEIEHAHIVHHNQLRVDLGVHPLVRLPSLDYLARDWSSQQAQSDQLAHADPISAGVTSDWTKIGENVGTWHLSYEGIHGGTDDQGVLQAFVDSSLHYENIIDSDYSHIGVGAAIGRNNRNFFVTVRFMG